MLEDVFNEKKRIYARFAFRLCFVFVVCRCFIWRTKAELRARVILDVARCYLWLFTLYINIKNR